MVATHTFTFRDEHAAARFVWRVHDCRFGLGELELGTFRDGAMVRVFDHVGCARRLIELARESGVLDLQAP